MRSPVATDNYSLHNLLLPDDNLMQIVDAPLLDCMLLSHLRYSDGLMKAQSIGLDSLQIIFD